MSTRRVAFRQCDVTRALKAAKAAGAGSVIVRRDGSLAIEIEVEKNGEGFGSEDKAAPSGKRREIVL